MIKRNASTICLWTSFLAVTIVSIKIFQPNQLEYRKCQRDELDIFEKKPTKVECVIDAAGAQWFHLWKSGDPVQYEKLRLSREDFPFGAGIYTTSFNKTALELKFDDEQEYRRFIPTSTSDGLAIVSQINLSSEELNRGVEIYPATNHGQSIFLRFFALEKDSNLETLKMNPAYAFGASRWHVIILLGSLLSLFIFAVLKYHKSKHYSWALAALSACFFGAVLNFELPFKGNSGQIDAADDTYYMAYAISHLTYQEPFRCKTDVHFTQKKAVPCYGLPGAPWLLELGILANSLVVGDSFWGKITLSKLRAMRSASAMYAMLAIFALFFALHFIKPNYFNIILASSLIWGSSLSKWAFDRAIFTHSPELFLSCCFCLVMVLNLKGKISDLLCSVFFSFLLGIMIFVRGEYLIILPFIALYFLKKREGQPALKWLSNLIPLFTYAVLSSVALYTYYQVSKSIGAYARGKEPLIISSFSDVFSLSFYSRWIEHLRIVFYSFYESGSIVYIGAFCLAGLLFQKKVNRLTLSALTFVSLYFFLTTLFYSPLGAEWQHRYFLKLYPILLICAGFFFNSSSKKIKITLLFAFIYANIAQQYLVNDLYAQVPKEKFERFKYVLTDMQVDIYGFVEGYYQNLFLFYLLLTLAFLFCLIREIGEFSKITTYIENGKTKFPKLAGLSIVLIGIVLISKIYEKISIQQAR